MTSTSLKWPQNDLIQFEQTSEEQIQKLNEKLTQKDKLKIIDLPTSYRLIAQKLFRNLESM